MQIDFRSPWVYAAAAGGFLAVAGATTLIKSGGSSGQRAQTQTLHRSWYYFSPGATYAIGPMTFDQPISATEFRRLVREQLGFSLPRGTEVWPTEARERGGVRRTGRRDATPIWQDRNGRYQLFARGDQDFYLLDRMYSDRLTPEFSPDGRGIRWLGHAAEPVPISVSSAALDLHKAQRAARGVERYRQENPWRAGHAGWSNQRADGTRRFHRAYLDATHATEQRGWRQWPDGTLTALELDDKGLVLRTADDRPRFPTGIQTQLQRWSQQFNVGLRRC